MANPTENLDPNPPTREPEDEVEELNSDEGESEEDYDEEEEEDDDTISNPQSHQNLSSTYKTKTESLFRRMRSAPVPVRVHDVIVKGNTKTKDHIIKAEVDAVREANTLQELLEASRTLKMLELKESVLLKKAAGEVERAKDFSKVKNKRSAIQCLKRKRLYEQQVEQLGNFQLCIHDQMIMLEGAKATTDTVQALRIGAAAMKAMQKATNIDDVDKKMDEINELV